MMMHRKINFISWRDPPTGVNVLGYLRVGHVGQKPDNIQICLVQIHGSKLKIYI